MADEIDHDIPAKYYAPFRLVLDFHDQDLSDLGRVTVEGQILHQKLTTYLTDRLQQPVKVVFIASLPSSLDHRGYVQLDYLDGLGDTFAEVTAARWLFDMLKEFVDQKYRNQIKSYLAAVGVIRMARGVDELKNSPFPIDDMQYTHFETLGARPVEAKQNIRSGLVKAADRVRLGPVGAILLITLVCWNLYQQYSSNRQLDTLQRQISNLDQVQSQPDTPGSPTIIIEFHIDQPSEDANPQEIEPIEKIIVEQDGSPKIIRVIP